MKIKKFFVSLLVTTGFVVGGLAAFNNDSKGHLNAAVTDPVTTINPQIIFDNNAEKSLVKKDPLPAGDYKTDDQNVTYTVNSGDVKPWTVSTKDLTLAEFRYYKTSSISIKLDSSIGKVIKSIKLGGKLDKATNLVFSGYTYDLESKTWSSSNPQATVTATNSSSVCGIEDLIVTYGDRPAVKPLVGISLDKTAVDLNQYNSIQLNPIFNPTDATNQNVTWNSSDSSKASVVDGLVTGLAPGSVDITVTSEEGPFTATCKVTVIESQAQQYQLVKSQAEVVNGGVYIIGAADGTYGMGFPTSKSDNNIKGIGLAEVETNKYVQGSFDPTITEQLPLAEYTLEGSQAAGFAIRNGQNYLYSPLNNKNYLKYDSNPYISGTTTLDDGFKWSISIDDTGVATIKAGSGTTGDNYRNWFRYNINTGNSPMFSCYNKGQSDISLYKKVTPAVESVTIDAPSTTTLGQGESLQLTAKVLPVDALQSVKWSSSAPNIASVDADSGLVTGVSEGVATITAVSPENAEKMNSIDITVNVNEIIGISITNKEDLKKQYIGEQFNGEGLIYKIEREDGLLYDVDPADYTLKLFAGVEEQADMLIRTGTDKLVVSLNGTNFKDELAFTPYENVNKVFQKVTDLSVVKPGSKVIIANSGTADTLKAVSKVKTTSDTGDYRKVNPLVVENDTVKIPETDLKNTEFAIFDIEKGSTANTVMFYDFANNGYLAIFKNEKGYHFRTYGGASSRTEWSLAMDENNISIKGQHDSTISGYIGFDTAAGKAIVAPNLAVNAVDKVNLYVYNPTVEELILNWGDHFLKMNDPSFEGEGTGECTKLFKDANKALIDLGTEAVNALQSAIDPSDNLYNIRLRYEAWARANDCTKPYELFVSPASNVIATLDQSQEIAFITILCLISLLSVGGFILSCRKHKMKDDRR